MTEPTPEQRKAMEIILGRAPDIQDDLRNYISKITEPYVKVIGQGSCIFDFAELVGYRINNSDRKSIRLNSSHVVISYAVFCLKKKTKNYTILPNFPDLEHLLLSNL